MGLFRWKKRPEAETIAEFWRWWSTVRDDVAAAVTSGTVERFTSGFASHVHGIDAGLEWELARGKGSTHALVVTSGGVAALRATAARWLAAAPLADDFWSYQCVRSADPSVFESTAVIGEHKVDLSQIRYAINVNQDSHQVDVTAFHPAFVDLPDNLRGQITFLTLDWTLGEDGVEIWVGEVGWTAAEPLDPKPPQDLRHAVAAMASDDSWVLMQGQKRDGTPILATAASPLRSARWPRFDLHVPIVVPYQRFNEGQLPLDESLQALRAFEDELSGAVGSNGALVAHETSGRARMLHFYVDSQTNACAELESRLPGWREGRATAIPRLDPGLDQVRHLMR